MMNAAKALRISFDTSHYSGKSLQEAWDVLDTEPQTGEIIAAKGRIWGALYRLFNGN